MLEQVVQGLKGCSTVRNESPVEIDELMKLALSCGGGEIPGWLGLVLRVGRFHWHQHGGQGSQELVLQGHS